MPEKGLKTPEGLGLQAVWPCWAPLGAIVEGGGRVPRGLPSGAFPHPTVTPRLGENCRGIEDRGLGSWVGAVLWEPYPVSLPCLGDSPRAGAGEVSRAPSCLPQLLGESWGNTGNTPQPLGGPLRGAPMAPVSGELGKVVGVLGQPQQGRALPEGPEDVGLWVYEGPAEGRGLSWVARGLLFSTCWPDRRWDPCFRTSWLGQSGQGAVPL